MPHLQADDLVLDYGPTRAVDEVSFSLESGELLAVFGPNGAGKTSLLRLLSGAARPSNGTIRLGGESLRSGDRNWHRRIGVLSHRSFLYDTLTAEENLRFYGRLFGLEDLDDRIPTRLEEVGLFERRRDPVANYSRGMRQRLALARSLLHDPEVVLLDEPYTGLDLHASTVLRGVLEALRDGRRTVVLVTHDLVQGLEMADRVAIQRRGRFAFLGQRSEIPPGQVEYFYRRVVGGEE